MLPTKNPRKQPRLTPVAKAAGGAEIKRRTTIRPPLFEAHSDVALVDIRDIEALIRLGKSWIHEAVRKGEFPAPVVKLPRCSRWKLAHVRQWLERVAQPQGEGAAPAASAAASAKAAVQAKVSRHA